MAVDGLVIFRMARVGKGNQEIVLQLVINCAVREPEKLTGNQVFNDCLTGELEGERSPAGSSRFTALVWR